jgi:16S rRNA G527 N7-methylase RsmG
MTDVLRADGKIADVGCGPGAPTIMMAAAFAWEGRY